MQAKSLSGGQELLCINTTKVYDWIVNEATFDVSMCVDLEDTDCDEVETVTCEVEPLKSVVLNRQDREFIIDGEPITLQLVTIQKTFEVTVFVTKTNGATCQVDSQTFTRCEQVILCAPDGTKVKVDFTDVDCFVCVLECKRNPGGPLTLELGVTVRLCQSIQVTFPVTLEIVAEFCQPRDILPFNPACPTPAIPLQCPVLFPTTPE
ncbi:hypothetical protein P4646_02045 [Peribacillus simplex]|uniref:hypothetical protein n=1 Tax=Peribacillus simplex TaxID=1478 RepID=UPI0011DCF0B6|nr:hypothetical protein [Peribacillus simplex]MED3982873.1 hypothetical protein [Peribacillus simplex]MED4095584.1 hypothetical protein [Peribacillus simplex]CAH0319979.1 hypothetical protein SRABI84_05220 [Peribacillus simplex]